MPRDCPLARAELQSHKYWQRADWELVDGGILPSPLEVREPADEIRSSQGKGVDLFNMMLRTKEDADSESFARVSKNLGDSQSIQRRLDLIEEGRLATDSASESLIEQENDMYVEGWDFVSERALAQEYLHTLALRGSRPLV